MQQPFWPAPPPPPRKPGPKKAAAKGAPGPAPVGAHPPLDPAPAGEGDDFFGDHAEGEEDPAAELDMLAVLDMFGDPPRAAGKAKVGMVAAEGMPLRSLLASEARRRLPQL